MGILESDPLMLSQKLTLTPSHGTAMDIVDIMDIPIDTDTVVTTGDRFLCHQYWPFALNYLIRHIFLSKFQCDKLIYNYSMSSEFSFANKKPFFPKKKKKKKKKKK